MVMSFGIIAEKDFPKVHKYMLQWQFCMDKPTNSIVDSPRLAGDFGHGRRPPFFPDGRGLGVGQPTPSPTVPDTHLLLGQNCSRQLPQHFYQHSAKIR